MDNLTNTNAAQEVDNPFEQYVAALHDKLSFVEDDTFKWDDVVALLVLKLSNTDSVSDNKTRRASHASQIQLTGEKTPVPGKSKTEDFFPTLALNTTFKSWRIKVTARIHSANLAELDGRKLSEHEHWVEDSVQIRRRLLNADDNNQGNPNLQICYGDDLRPLRERLQVNDYLVFTKRKQQTAYEAFGVRTDVDLGNKKDLYTATKTDDDSSVFSLPDLETITPAYLSPAWFRVKADEYSDVDLEANALYQQFHANFSIEKLKSFSGEELLSRIFLGKADDNLCNALEFDARYSQFGSIAGGTAYKYSLYYSKSNQSWQTSFGEGGQRSITEEEAIVIGKQIRDALVAGAEIISGYEEIATANDYNGLLATLTETIPQYITKMWFLKYYHMMFPNIIPNFYNENWHKYILCNLGIIPSDAQFIRMGQINCFVKECGISNIVFNRIIHDTLGSPKVLYRIGTGDNGELMPEWRRDNYVAIGWNELGDLNDAYKDGVDSKVVITNGLKEGWNYDARLASRKYGEINNFYSAIADSTYIVAMKGQKILGIGTLSGNYNYAPEKDYAHCRAVNWIRLFDEEKILPQASEGTRTTFYPLTNSENLCYLYALIHNKDDYSTEKSETGDSIREIRFHTGYTSDFSRNRILFGAPGTGKSFTLNKERSELLGVGNETDYERVTFHPDYSYANFVGTYKPVPVGDVITYAYVPGPFMRVYVEALKNGRTDDVRPFLLIIEEINRANVAAVFGDVFQLLDRGSDEASEYPIQASEDIKKYLAKELGGKPENYTKIRIPDNMFIWATMNSADQGVFPMDTAFKRRWDFTYLGINTSEAGIRGKKVILGIGENARTVEWNELRHAINDRLSSFKINEDKLLGPYFISKKIVPESGEIDTKRFIDTFKSKVLMYLFDDAAKQKRPSLFAEGIDVSKYSSICEAFDLKGVVAFCSEISGRFNDIPTQTETETATEADVDATEGEN